MNHSTAPALLHDSYPSTRLIGEIEFPIIVLAGTVLACLAMDWIAAPALLLLWAIWRYLPCPLGPPVLQLALTFQWLQVFIGVYYFQIFGRESITTSSGYRDMVLLGLVSLAALFAGLFIGSRQPSQAQQNPVRGELFSLDLRVLLLTYVVAVFASGILTSIAWSIPRVAQGLLALSWFRFALLFMLYRRLVPPRPIWGLFATLMAIELVLGFAGYFAGFKTTLMLGILAVVERFEPRNKSSWLAIGVLATAVLLTGVVWTGIKNQYRSELRTTLLGAPIKDRISRVGELAREWRRNGAEATLTDLDRMVERIWAVYYPAKALERVPEIEPHTNGQFTFNAVMHVLRPRLLFPQKGALVHDSDKVRQYTGIHVAGKEQGVSIAFGYAIESYIDFGVPLMFLPIFLWGCFMGWAYRVCLAWTPNRELTIAITCVICWKSLYLFEKSWDKTLGEALTLVIFLLTATKCCDLFFRGNPLRSQTR